MRARLDRAAVHADDARGRAKECPAYRDGFSFGRGGKLEHVGVVAGGAEPCLRDGKAEAFGESRRVDFVDLLASGGLEESFENGAGDGSRIHLVDFAAVINVQSFDALGRNLRQEAPEFLPEAQMRPHDRQRFGIEVGHVDGVADGSLEEDGSDGLGDFDSDALLRFRRRSTEVRSEDKIWRLAQRRVGRQRFFFEDIESGCGDVTALERLDQGCFLDQPAAGAVNNADTGPRFLQASGIKQMARLWGEGSVQRNKVGMGEEVVQFLH